MYLTHWDVNLSYSRYKNRQKEIEELSGNENLRIGDLFNFSKKFKEKIEELKNKGYEIKEVKAHLIVYWKGEDMEEEIKIILPKLLFERSDQVNEVTNFL
jgi:ATP-dependent DNA helicase RecQ